MREFFVESPFRRPSWRSDRVMQMVDRRPSPLRPRRYDDNYVRTYRRFLLDYLDAGDDEAACYAVYLKKPHIYRSHQFQFHPDREYRDIVQALLLTADSIERIARKMCATVETINHYEKLFFNIRDRMDSRNWLLKVVMGNSEDLAANKTGVMTEDQRGFLYRLFAFYGGPVILEAAISGMTLVALPMDTSLIEDWFDETLAQIVRSRAAQAARIFEINRYNVLHFLEIAMTSRNISKAAKTDTESNSKGIFDDYAGKVLGSLNWGLAEKLSMGMSSDVQAALKSAIEPRASEQLLIGAGNMPISLTHDVTRMDVSRINLQPIGVAEEEVVAT